MNKISTFFAIFVLSAFSAIAAPTYTSSTFPSNGQMLEDYLYQNQANQTNIKVLSGSTHASIIYADCPNDYPNTDVGALTTDECYRACTVADLAVDSHAATASGKNYYGANETDTCEIDTCAAGYYKDNGACVECAAGKYCPGDNAQYDCPTATDHKRTTFPAEYYTVIRILATSLMTGPGLTDITQCEVSNHIDTSRGKLYEHVKYNASSQKYDGTVTWFGWYTVTGGYYLSSKGSCGTYAYYRTVNECSAGSYCPGKEAVICNSSNQATVHTTTFGLETCPAGTYSAAGASSCTPVSGGYYNTGCGTSATGAVCDANNYSGGKVTAGYFSSGGGTSATPTSNDCLTGNTCGQCTTDPETGRPTYTGAGGGATTCSVCPAVTDEFANRVRGNIGYYPSSLHGYGVSRCLASFTDSDDDATFKTVCYYSPSRDNYTDSENCQAIAPTACAAGTYNTITSTSEWRGEHALCTGIDCMNGKVCTATTAGYYSPEGATTQTQCPSGYTSDAGATAESECYRTCTTSQFANSSSVSGNDYYGSNGKTCTINSCNTGYTAFSGNPDLTTIIGVTEAGTASASIDNSGSASGTTSDYGITANNTFGVDYGSGKGRITGKALCSTQSGTNNSYTWTNPTTNTTMTPEFGVEGALYCYCQLDSYTSPSGATQSLSAPWVFRNDGSSASYCASYCAINCANYLRNDNDIALAFRAAMFNAAAPSCVANTIAIVWDHADEADITANDAGSVTYGGNINTPKKAQHINGKIFTGWTFITPQQ